MPKAPQISCGPIKGTAKLSQHRPPHVCSLTLCRWQHLCRFGCSFASHFRRESKCPLGHLTALFWSKDCPYPALYMMKIKAMDQDHIEVKGVTRSHKGIFCPRTHPVVLKSRDNLPLGNWARWRWPKAGAQMPAVHALAAWQGQSLYNWKQYLWSMSKL